MTLQEKSFDLGSFACRVILNTPYLCFCNGDLEICWDCKAAIWTALGILQSLP